MRIVLLAFLFVTTTRKNGVDADPIIRTIDSAVSYSTDVQYNCKFENQWTRDRHPTKFPQSAVHWTRQLLASHPSTYNMWKEGTLASTAVRQMAEGGGTAQLIRDLEDRADYDYEVGYSKYGSVVNSIMHFANPLTVTRTNRYVSVIAKMAPSPDWFSGFHDFNAVNEERGTWYREFTIETYPYDAGTENGDDYDVVNSPTIPPQPITQITSENASGIYTKTSGEDVLPVARYTCQLNTYSSSNVDIVKIDSTLSTSTIPRVQYGCVFENLWNRQNHPYRFPDLQSNSIVHWSKQILVSHNEDYTLWKEGEMATEAIQKLAEKGAIGNILEEIQQNEDYDSEIGYDKYLYALDPKVEYEPITVTASNKYLSAIAKMVPSPDWFSGFHDFNCINEEDDAWYKEFRIPIYPFDAGTKEGNNYNTTGADTIPQRPIKQFTLDNLPNNEIFLNKDRNAILPVGIYICTLDTENVINPITTTSPPTTPELTNEQQNTASIRTDNRSNNKTLNVGKIIGVTIGVSISVFTIGAVVLLFVCRRRRHRRMSMTPKDISITVENNSGNGSSSSSEEAGKGTAVEDKELI